MEKRQINWALIQTSFSQWLKQYEDSFKEGYKDKNQNPFFKTFKETNTYNKEIRQNGAKKQPKQSKQQGLQTGDRLFHQ